MAKSMHYPASFSAPVARPRRCLSLVGVGVATLCALLLSLAFYLLQVPRLAVEFPPAVPPGSVPQQVAHPGFGSAANMAEHPMFAPLTAAPADATPKIFRPGFGE
ncbi:hypothetical protein [Rufibacter immobilis]|nr:hypothetical protein [Rufibacter immobilis]